MGRHEIIIIVTKKATHLEKNPATKREHPQCMTTYKIKSTIDYYETKLCST